MRWREDACALGGTDRGKGERRLGILGFFCLRGEQRAGRSSPVDIYKVGRGSARFVKKDLNLLEYIETG